jgi:hypothetical protein
MLDRKMTSPEHILLSLLNALETAFRTEMVSRTFSRPGWPVQQITSVMRNASLDIPVLDADEFFHVGEDRLHDARRECDGAEGPTYFRLRTTPGPT